MEYGKPELQQRRERGIRNLHDDGRVIDVSCD